MSKKRIQNNDREFSQELLLDKIKGVPAKLCVCKEPGLPHFRSAWAALMEKDSNDF